MKPTLLTLPTDRTYKPESPQAHYKAKRNLKKVLTMALAGYNAGGLRTVGLIPAALAKMADILNSQPHAEAGPRDLSDHLDRQIKVIDSIAKFLPFVLDKESQGDVLTGLAQLTRGNQGQLQISFHQHFQERGESPGPADKP